MVNLLLSSYVQVVEVLIRKLENETSFHRKVDLFFLVDSITQCSHSHKGGEHIGLSFSICFYFLFFLSLFPAQNCKFRLSFVPGICN